MDEPFVPAPDPTGGLSLAPQGPLSALDLGIPAPLAQVVGPQPTLPTPPPVAPLPLHAPGPMDPKQQLLAIAALGAMLGGGPRSGVAAGFGQGTANMLAAAQARKDAQVKQQQAEEEKLRVQLEAQQRAEAQRQAQRQQQLQTALTQMHARVANIPDKQTYDNEITGYANILQAAGYRGLDANWLRQAVPYVAPSAEKIAGTALDSFLKNPANQQLIQQHPEQLSKVVLTLDVDGDGLPEQVPLLRVAQIAKKPFATDASGALIEYPKGTTLDDKANADGFFNDYLTQAKAEGKDITDPTVRNALRERAIKKAEDLKAKPPKTVNPDEADAIADNARQIFAGNLLPTDLSKRGASYNQTLHEANQISIRETGKPLNINKLKLDYEAAKKMTDSMNSQQMLRFHGLATSVVNTIDEVRRLGDELQQGNIRKWNAVRRSTIQSVYGNTPQSELANQYVAAVNTLKEEFANLANGGTAPTEPAWHLANEQINGDFGFKDLRASLTEVQRLINFRVNALDSQSPRTIGGTPPFPESPVPTRFEIVTRGIAAPQKGAK